MTGFPYLSDEYNDMVKKKRENKDTATLIKDLQVQSVFTRKSAIIDLASRRAKEALPDVLKVLKDREATLRGCAAWALGELGEPKAVKPLIACLKDMDVEVRRASAQSLAKLADPSSLAALKEASVDSDRWVQEWARKGVEVLGPSKSPKKARKSRPSNLKLTP